MVTIIAGYELEEQELLTKNQHMKYTRVPFAALHGVEIDGL
jgi:hypothetical protein